MGIFYHKAAYVDLNGIWATFLKPKGGKKKVKKRYYFLSLTLFEPKQIQSF